jgi:hypothetical protein
MVPLGPPRGERSEDRERIFALGKIRVFRRDSPELPLKRKGDSVLKYSGIKCVDIIPEGRPHEKGA